MAAGLLLGACGDGGTGDSGADGEARIVVTTTILGDVVAELVGDDASVEVLMPPGSDPHDFAPSARQAADLRRADVLVVNGLGFESSLDDTIEAAQDDGVVVVVAADGVDALPLGVESTSNRRRAGDADPHFFTDPVRMRAAARHMADGLVEQIPSLDSPAFRARVEAYLAELDALDAEVRALVATIPEERRVLVTNHEVFGYFADRYGFEVLGAVLPGGSTVAEPSAADLAALAEAIQRAGVPAIFAETSSPTRLADALAGEGQDVAVVELYSESLGERGSDGATYLQMVRTNAERIAAALT